MIKSQVKFFIVSIFSLTLAACGGGGGSGSSASNGIGGTGAAASVTTGKVTGFGSIFVNGIEFETDNASIIVDDSAASQSNLSVGMVVKVTGTVNDDGVTGTATRVDYDAKLEGPIATTPTVNADNTEIQFTLLNTTVIIQANSTVFKNATFNGLSAGDMVDVSGFYNANGALVASYVQKKSDNFVPNSTKVEVKGTVTNFNGTDSFILSIASGVSLTINFNYSTDLSELPNTTVANDLYVEVEGTMASASATSITATKIENEGLDDHEGDASIEGYVTNYVSLSSFSVGSIKVDASSASLEPVSLTIANGAHIEVEGSMANGVLKASKVEIRGGSIEIHASVSSVNTSTGVVTLLLGDGTLTVTVNSQTEMEDEVSKLEPFYVNHIANGDFLRIEAYQDDSSKLIASQVKRDSQDDTLLQGPVSGFDSSTRSVSILGVSFFTTGASFENSSDVSISSGDFFSQVSTKDLVKVVDRATADGTADEVEFED